MDTYGWNSHPMNALKFLFRHQTDGDQGKQYFDQTGL